MQAAPRTTTVTMVTVILLAATATVPTIDNDDDEYVGVNTGDYISIRTSGVEGSVGNLEVDIDDWNTDPYDDREDDISDDEDADHDDYIYWRHR